MEYTLVELIGYLLMFSGSVTLTITGYIVRNYRRNDKNLTINERRWGFLMNYKFITEHIELDDTDLTRINSRYYPYTVTVCLLGR